MTQPKTDTKTLIEALRILANDIQSDDGIANLFFSAAISEAADRLEELTNRKPDWWRNDEDSEYSLDDPIYHLEEQGFYTPCRFTTAFNGPTKWCVLLPKIADEDFGEVLCCDTLEEAEAACEERRKALEDKQ